MTEYKLVSNSNDFRVYLIIHHFGFYYIVLGNVSLNRILYNKDYISMLDCFVIDVCVEAGNIYSSIDISWEIYSAMPTLKKYCSGHIVICLSVAQLIVGLVTLLQGCVIGPFVIQTSSFSILFSVFLINKILHQHDGSLKHIVLLSVVLPTTILSETLCITSISTITIKIESRMLREPYSKSKFEEYHEGAKLIILINAAILYMVNGTVLIYLWLNMANLYYLTNWKLKIQWLITAQ